MPRTAQKHTSRQISRFAAGLGYTVPASRLVHGENPIDQFKFYRGNYYITQNFSPLTKSHNESTKQKCCLQNQPNLLSYITISPKKFTFSYFITTFRYFGPAMPLFHGNSGMPCFTLNPYIVQLVQAQYKIHDVTLIFPQMAGLHANASRFSAHKKKSCRP